MRRLAAQLFFQHFQLQPFRLRAFELGLGSSEPRGLCGEGPGIAAVEIDIAQSRVEARDLGLKCLDLLRQLDQRAFALVAETLRPDALARRRRDLLLARRGGGRLARAAL